MSAPRVMLVAGAAAAAALGLSASSASAEPVKPDVGVCSSAAKELARGSYRILKDGTVELNFTAARKDLRVDVYRTTKAPDGRVTLDWVQRRLSNPSQTPTLYSFGVRLGPNVNDRNDGAPVARVAQSAWPLPDNKCWFSFAFKGDERPARLR